MAFHFEAPQFRILVENYIEFLQLSGTLPFLEKMWFEDVSLFPISQLRINKRFSKLWMILEANRKEIVLYYFFG
jgi:hypothetical protein